MGYPQNNQDPKPLQSDAYYLKSMSWHMKEIASELKNTNSLLDRLIGALQNRQYPLSGQPTQQRPQPQHIQEIPF